MERGVRRPGAWCDCRMHWTVIAETLPFNTRVQKTTKYGRKLCDLMTLQIMASEPSHTFEEKGRFSRGQALVIMQSLTGNSWGQEFALCIICYKTSVRQASGMKIRVSLRL